MVSHKSSPGYDILLRDVFSPIGDISMLTNVICHLHLLYLLGKIQPTVSLKLSTKNIERYLTHICHSEILYIKWLCSNELQFKKANEEN